MGPQFIAGTVFISLAAASLLAAETVSKPDNGLRSHIQPVGEIAAESPPWAGLTTSRAPAVLRRQLAMDRGAGLIVEEVAAGSVAEKAGLRQHDVLVSLDGQLLVLPEQLMTLLEESGQDAPLACRVIRGGKEAEFSLRVRSITPLPTRGRAALKPAASALALLPAKPASPLRPAAPGRPVKTPATTGMVRQLADGSLLQRDPDFLIHVTGGSETRLVVKDARARIVFNDAIETPEQRSLIPTAVRSRVESLEKLLVQRVVQPVITEESAQPAPVSKIGGLDIEPIKVR
ncbi:MAG: PDZ domain-containing protein [Planctomycetota bacterium]